MINFEEVACKSNELISMTGYTFEEFNALLPTFEEAVFECNRTLEGKERKNKPAAYSNSTFSSTANQLFFYFGLHEAVHNANHAGKAVWNLSTESKFMDSLSYANLGIESE